MQLGTKSAGKVVPAEKPAEGLPQKEEIPVIEEEEIDVKDIPF